MTYEEWIEKFGLLPDEHSLPIIRQALAVEIRRHRAGNDISRESPDDSFEEPDDMELLRVLCIQLFAAGHVSDSLLIWRAKRASFDTGCGLDIQFLCGAGLDATRDFLARSGATDAVEYLDHCVVAGDFARFTPEDHLKYYRRYCGLEPSAP